MEILIALIAAAAALATVLTTGFFGYAGVKPGIGIKANKFHTQEGVDGYDIKIATDKPLTILLVEASKGVMLYTSANPVLDQTGWVTEWELSGSGSRSIVPPCVRSLFGGEEVSFPLWIKPSNSEHVIRISLIARSSNLPWRIKRNIPIE